MTRRPPFRWTLPAICRSILKSPMHVIEIIEEENNEPAFIALVFGGFLCVFLIVLLYAVMVYASGGLLLLGTLALIVLFDLFRLLGYWMLAMRDLQRAVEGKEDDK